MTTRHDDNPVRVLLVGAEPSRALRADESVELVRVRSAVDAVAELTTPELPETNGRTPGARVVALAESALASEESLAFLAAARDAAPDARFLLCRRDDATPLNGTAKVFDRVVIGPLTREALAFDRPETPSPEPPPPPRPAAPVQTSEPAPQAREGSLLDESADLEALLTGQNALEAFLHALRARLADPTLRFVTDPANAPSSAAARASVTRRDASFGVLTSSRLDRRTLEDAAGWLARRLALAEQMRQLREAALTDPLTGAHNRRFFDRYLPYAIDQARLRRLEAHLLIIDIDNFKQFNDRFGHPAGDEILIETARMLKSVVRPCDKVCRLGGDEFAVIFYEPEGPRDQNSGSAPSALSLSKVAARIQRVVCEKRFPKLGKEAPAQLSVSGGLATFPWDAVDAATLVQRADQLALESKHAGKSVITLGPGSKACEHR